MKLTSRSSAFFSLVAFLCASLWAFVPARVVVAQAVPFQQSQYGVARPLNVGAAPSLIRQTVRYGVSRVTAPYGQESQFSIDLPSRSEMDPLALYQVASKEISWTTDEGLDYSALVFYPITPPINGGKFSAVIYSHGLGASAENFAYLGYAWAGRGIITICLKHPGSDESIWRRKLRAMNELREAYQKYWTARDRAEAISATVDFLYAHHAEAGPLGRDLDLSKIGAAGNDLGALAALLVVGQLPPDNGSSLKDDRIAAILAMSPPVFCDSNKASYVYESVRSPSMFIMGTNDNGIVGTTKAEQRRIPYDSIQGVDRYLVILEGGDHRVYGGRKVGAMRSGDASYQETISRETCDFWRAYLLRDPVALRQMNSQGRTSPLPNARVEWRVSSQVAFD